MTTGSDTPVTKAAIVTGSATGIGAAVARALASRGWGVVINYTRSEREARETVAACRAAGGEAVLCRGDVAFDADCRRLVATALEAFGRLDALVNNAGITKFVAADDMDGLDAADFDRIFAVNVLGAFQMARAARATLEASGDGAIVNLSSYSGMNGLGSSLAYAASKGALNTLTKGLAHTLAPHVRVNAVCPGYADTRWARVGPRGRSLRALQGGPRGHPPAGAHALGGGRRGDRAVVSHRRPHRHRSAARDRLRRAHGGRNRTGRRLTAHAESAAFTPTGESRPGAAPSLRASNLRNVDTQAARNLPLLVVHRRVADGGMPGLAASAHRTSSFVPGPRSGSRRRTMATPHCWKGDQALEQRDRPAHRSGATSRPAVRFLPGRAGPTCDGACRRIPAPACR